MRATPVLIVYLLLIFVGGALLAPWLYWGSTQLFPDLSDVPFHRFVNRSLLGISILGIWPVLKLVGTRSAAEIGLVRPANQWSRLGLGFFIGFISIALIGGLSIAFHAREPAMKFEFAELAEKFLAIAATAMTVATLEEILFRGVLFGSLRRDFSWPVALVLSSVFYALVHFLESTRATGPVTWLSGLELLPKMMRDFPLWHITIPGLINLTMAGILLGIAFQRTGNLYFSIGVHAGWVFFLKVLGLFTESAPGASAWVWAPQLMHSSAAAPILVVAVVACLRLPEVPQQEPRT